MAVGGVNLVAEDPPDSCIIRFVFGASIRGGGVKEVLFREGILLPELGCVSAVSAISIVASILCNGVSEGRVGKDGDWDGTLDEDAASLALFSFHESNGVDGSGCCVVSADNAGAYREFVLILEEIGFVSLTV